MEISAGEAPNKALGRFPGRLAPLVHVRRRQNVDLLKELSTQYGVLVAVLIIANVAQAGALAYVVKLWRADTSETMKSWREDVADAGDKFADAMEKVAASNSKQAEALSALAVSQAEIKGVLSRIGG